MPVRIVESPEHAKREGLGLRLLLSGANSSAGLAMPDGHILNLAVGTDSNS